MKKFYFIFTIVAFIFFSNNVISQQIIDYRNADDILLKKKVAENPDIVNKYVIYEKEFKKLIDNIKENKDVRTDTLINGKRIIPVVFHIIHKGGAENITKAQILDAVEKINIDYAKMNADTANTYSIFKSRAADIKIELRLAQIDPWGNCTEGIDRVYDPQTNYGYFGTMHQYCWNPDKYMNIYAVNFIYPEGITLPEGAFIGGMSPFPPSNSLSSTLTGGDTLVDGVLIRQDCIGSIGTAVSLGGMPLNMLNRTFTHETGHYFNLYHPFQSLYAALGINGCGNFIITAGDEVSDTPPVAEATQNTSINCFTPGSRNTCSSTDAIYGIDAPDMIENYMDYQFGYCTNIFTLGQLERIDATLQSDRKNLWSKENLIATGVLNASPALCPPIADFYANRFMVCAGGEVTFTDYSYSGAAQDWLWTFDGGTPSTSTLQNPTVQYNTPGTYDVKLKVSNASGSDSLVKTIHIIVNDN
ncbi:MAG TPA: PKD domain-containing protein [Bacteroidales bacterium]|nr:PKD domain-containing protein [Bacteroidales bacterium]HPS16694.1 PKD domain-containing protein [Bacteroidales bacterium]